MQKDKEKSFDKHVWFWVLLREKNSSIYQLENIITLVFNKYNN